jgi:hypothetical protein
MLFSPDDIVEFVDPLEDEVGTTYRVVEVNGDRCIIELVCDMRPIGRFPMFGRA